MKRLLLVLILFCSAVHALTFNRSTGTGLASNANNWSTRVAPCGAGGDGVFLAVQTLIVNDCASIGSTIGINGLRIEAGGSLCAYDRIHTNTCGNTSTQGAQVIYFNSTGTNPIGSGSVTNPGSDATAFGLFISYGTFQFLGDANDQLTLTPANTSYPIYVAHEFNAYSGGIGIGAGGETGGAAQSIHGGVLTCRYCKFVNVGSPAFPPMMEGLAYELRSAETTPVSSLDIEHYEFDSPYEFTIGNSAGFLFNYNWTMANGWFNGCTGQFLFNIVNVYGGGFNITNFTETGCTTTGQTAKFVYRPATLTWTGNVTVGTSDGTVQRGQLLIQTGGAAGGPLTISNNAVFNSEGAVTSSSNAFDVRFAANDATSTISGNIAWGTYQPFYFISPPSTSGPLLNNNWGAQWKEAALGQGVYESAGCYFNLKNNIAIVENDHGNIPMLLYSSVCPAAAVFKVDNMTLYFVSPGNGNSAGVDIGDTGGTSTAVASPSWFRSSIIYGAYSGYVNNTANYYSTSGIYGVGPSDNLVYGAHSGRDYCGAGATCPSHGTGVGYDNGSVYHPNLADYGDLSDATNPSFLDPTRRPTGYSTHCGGRGTIADLGVQYSLRDGLGAAYNNCYDITKMLLWLQVGFAPRNPQLNQAGYNHTYVGAVPVLPMAGGLTMTQ
jgi:hypothetical protein